MGLTQARSGSGNVFPVDLHEFLWVDCFGLGFVVMYYVQMVFSKELVVIVSSLRDMIF